MSHATKFGSYPIVANAAHSVRKRINVRTVNEFVREIEESGQKVDTKKANSDGMQIYTQGVAMYYRYGKQTLVLQWAMRLRKHSADNSHKADKRGKIKNASGRKAKYHRPKRNSTRDSVKWGSYLYS